MSLSKQGDTKGTMRRRWHEGEQRVRSFVSPSSLRALRVSAPIAQWSRSRWAHDSFQIRIIRSSHDLAAQVALGDADVLAGQPAKVFQVLVRHRPRNLSGHAHHA